MSVRNVVNLFQSPPSSDSTAPTPKATPAKLKSTSDASSTSRATTLRLEGRKSMGLSNSEGIKSVQPVLSPPSGYGVAKTSAARKPRAASMSIPHEYAKALHSTSEERKAIIAANEAELAHLKEEMILAAERKRQRQELEQLTKLQLALLKGQVEKKQLEERLERKKRHQDIAAILQEMLEVKTQLQLKEQINATKLLWEAKQRQDEKDKEQLHLIDLRHQLKKKQLEQRIREDELQLKENVIATSKELLEGKQILEKEQNRLKMNQLLLEQLEFTKKTLAAEEVELDSRPPEIQYSNTSTWTCLTVSRLKYTYDHKERRCLFNSSESIELKYNAQAFAKGSVRFAHYGILPATNERVVVKKFIYTNSSMLDKDEAVEMVKTHYAADYFAEQYNKKKPPSTPSMKVSILEIIETASQVWTMEPILDGVYEKWNNNDEYVNNAAEAPQALTHFSYIESESKMLLVDLQGVKKGDMYILTDPAFHTHNTIGFGELNKGMKGFNSYFTRHSCSSICRHMHLQMHPSQLV